MRPLAVVTAGALGTWLGIHAIRAFLTTMVWNVAEDVPALTLALAGLAVWLVGLAGWLPARLLDRPAAAVQRQSPRAALALGSLFLALSIGRQATGDELAHAVLAIAALVCWLWWLPSFLALAADGGGARLLATAILLGVSAQVAGQLAHNGLDLHVLPGALPTLLIGVPFVVALVALSLSTMTQGGLARWAPMAVLPYLFLQMTLLANLGRVQAMAGVELLAAGALVAGGLVAGALGATWRPTFSARLALATATAVSLVAASFGGVLALLLVPGQAGLGCLLAAVLAPAATTDRPRVHVAACAGGLAFFVLLFAVYYDFADTLGVVAWPAAVLVILLSSLRREAMAPSAERVGRGRRVLPAGVAGVAGVAALGLAIAAMPTLPAAPDAPGTSDGLTVLNWNIHQGVGRNGVPNMPRTLGVMEAAAADVIALQEVNRTWDLAGGVDSHAWLRSRLPGYQAVFGPMHGIHFGNAIFSRYPIIEWGFERFPRGASGLPRGFTWALIDTPLGRLVVTSAHLTAYERGDEADERAHQATRLLDFWVARGRPPTIFAGDYNSEPGSAAVRRTLSAGLLDARAELGLGTGPTYRSTGTWFDPPADQNIDYVFLTPELVALRGSIVDSDASDHFPIVIGVGRR